MRAELLRALSLTREVQSRSDDALLPFIRWLPGQLRFLQSDSRRKLYRAGNQSLGKTTAGLADVHWTAAGAHPYLRRPRPPTESWVICQSWSQSVSIMGKFWKLIPKAQLDPSTEFDPRVGFRGRNPMVQYRNGSIVRFKTTGQGAGNLAGATIHHVLIDEPTHPRLYEELNKRVLKTGGSISLCMTPINGPVAWLREMVEQGQVEDIHTPLTPEALIPVGSHGPLRLDDEHRTPMDADWIAELRRMTIPADAPVVIDGEWETRVSGRLFVAWDASTMKSAVLPGGSVELYLGIDYGAGDRAYAQTAVLVAVQNYTSGGRRYQRIHVLDERTADGTTTSKQNAASVLDMLKANGISWRDLDGIFGDKPVRSRFVQKSNVTMMGDIARLLGVTFNRLEPRIKRAKSGRGNRPGSVSEGCAFLHQAMVRGDFRVHSRCSRLLEGLDKWDYTTSHPLKDIIDALRYSLKDYIFSKAQSRSRPILQVA